MMPDTQTSTHLNRQILKLGIPAVISNITVPLLGMSDTAISGHLGAGQLAAIALGSSMVNTVFWLFGFLRMGTTGLTAQALGANNNSEVKLILTRSVALALCGSLLILLLEPVLENALLYLLSDGGNSAHLAQRYYRICIFGAPALLATMAFNGWFIGLQNTVIPMTVAISVNVLNILLSLLFVFGAGFGFTGVAMGTLCANWIGLALAFLLAVKLRKGKGLWEFKKVFDPTGIRKFFKVNNDIFFRSACIMAVSLGVTAIGSRLGDNILAANGVMMQFFLLFSYFMDGFAFAGEALSGKYKGASDYYMLRKSIKYLIYWSAGMAFVFTIIYIFEGMSIAGLLTNQTEILSTLYKYRTLLWLIPAASVCAFIFDGFYIGVTATAPMLWVTLTSASIFFIICFYHPWQTPHAGLPDNTTLWIAFLCYLFLRGILLGLMSHKFILNGKW